LQCDLAFVLSTVVKGIIALLLQQNLSVLNGAATIQRAVRHT